MTIVSTMAGTAVQEFWKGFMPVGTAQNPIVHYRSPNAWASITFKDLHAQAHCAAAFLMSKGLRKGDHVAILSRQTPDYIVLDIALQFLGAVNVTLAEDITQQELHRLAGEYQFQFVYYADPAAFLAHGQLPELKADLRGVIIASDEVDSLDPENIVTFDRVVNLGKAEWREGVAALNAMKAAVQPNDPYARVHPQGDGSQASKAIRFSDLLAATAAAEKRYAESEAKLVLSLLDPIHMLQRSHGTFAALRLQIPFYLLPQAALTQAMLAELRPSAIVTTPEGVQHLYQELPTYLGDAEAADKAFEKARTVVAKRDEALSQNKKNPFFNGMRYRFGNQKLYRRIHTKLGGQLQFLISDKILLHIFRCIGSRHTTAYTATVWYKDILDSMQ